MDDERECRFGAVTHLRDPNPKRACAELMRPNPVRLRSSRQTAYGAKSSPRHERAMRGLLFFELKPHQKPFPIPTLRPLRCSEIRPAGSHCVGSGGGLEVL